MELFDEIINGSFTLSALLRTPKEFTKWNGFIGGPRGAFWCGAKDQKWVIGKQYGRPNEFCLFGEKPNVVVDEEVHITLTRIKNEWELYVNGNRITSASCTRSKCDKLETYTIGCGMPDGTEKWNG